LSVRVLPKIETDAISQTYGRFVIGPLESGFGVTLGNSLRRVLLSSLRGAAITSVRISDVPHEFSTIPSVREGAMQIILQLKQIRLTMSGNEAQRMVLEVRSEGTVTAGDIVCPPEIEILNPDLYLFSVDSGDVDLDIDLTVEQGHGYLPAEGRGGMSISELPVDAIFSPIQRVAFDVDRARVGQMTNYDRLTMEIWSDGRIAPFDALKEAARILVAHLRLIAGLTIEEEEVEPVPDEPRVRDGAYEVDIEQLDLSMRVFNALKRTGVGSVGEVLEMLDRGEDSLMAIRNFGDKSLIELKSKLGKGGFLGDETKSGGA